MQSGFAKHIAIADVILVKNRSTIDLHTALHTAKKHKKWEYLTRINDYHHLQVIAMVYN